MPVALSNVLLATAFCKISAKPKTYICAGKPWAGARGQGCQARDTAGLRRSLRQVQYLKVSSDDIGLLFRTVSSHSTRLWSPTLMGFPNASSPQSELIEDLETRRMRPSSFPKPWHIELLHNSRTEAHNTTRDLVKVTRRH